MINTVVQDFSGDHAPRFECLGEVSLKDNKLSNSFLKNGAFSILCFGDIVISSSDIVLFGTKYGMDDALFIDFGHNFRSSWKNYFTIYRSALKSDTRIFEARVNETENRKYSHLRDEICVFMDYISKFLGIYWNDTSEWMCNEFLVSFLNDLTFFWSRVRKISDLPKFVISSNSTGNNKCPHAAFHLLHTQLDLLCYRLIIFCRLEHLVSSTELQNALCNVYEDKKQYINSLLHDLFLLSISRFEKFSPTEIKRKSPFPCTCFKEMWLLVQIIIDKHNKASFPNEFWTIVSNLCLRLSSTNARQIGDVNNVTCSNPVLFSLWILLHLGQLYAYSENGEYIGSSCDRMLSNYPLLEKIIKSLLSVDVVSEAQLRLCLPFITELLLDLWPPQREPVFKLWEHFYRHINGCFFLPGTSAETVAINCTSGADMLLQVSLIMNPPANYTSRVDNSFNLFLRLLGSYLRKNPSQWPNIKGRIFSKFSQTKMQTLKEMGIFNFSILFLCLALASNTKEVGEKMQDLLNQCISASLDLNRRLMIWKAHFALLQLYIENGLDIGDASQLLMEDVNHICINKDSNSVALLNTLTRGFRDIIITSKTLDFSEYKLIGNWINFYLKLTSEPGLLIDTLLEIITRILSLSKSVGMIEYNASESNLTKMYLALCKHLLPYIKEKFANYDANNSNSQVADLAVNITLLALNRTSVGVTGTTVTHLFESFAVNANPLNAKLSIRYVCILLKEEGILSELMDTYSNYEVLFIQTWIRCSVYAIGEDSHEELSELTHIVCQMPSFVALCQEASVDIQSRVRPVDSFINALGQLYLKKNTLEERSQFREKCILYLTPMVKSFERMLRNKDVNEKIVCRIYEIAAGLILHCGNIIYFKSQPYCIFNSLVNTLLLPVAMFKPGVEIPSSMLCALQKTFPLFVKGIVQLNLTSGNALACILKNLIVRYFPRLVGKSSVASRERSTLPGHPLLLCFDAAENEVSRNVLEIISQSFLKVGDMQCVNALMFLLETLKKKQFNEEMVRLFIDISLPGVLEVIILNDVGMLAIKKQAVHLLKEAYSNKINSNTFLRESFWAVIWTAVQRHIVLHSVNIVSLLCKLCEIAPDMMTEKLQQIKEIIKSPQVFHRSNVANTMRLGVANMEKLLSLSKQHNK